MASSTKGLACHHLGVQGANGRDRGCQAAGLSGERPADPEGILGLPSRRVSLLVVGLLDFVQPDPPLDVWVLPELASGCSGRLRNSSSP